MKIIFCVLVILILSLTSCKFATTKMDLSNTMEFMTESGVSKNEKAEKKQDAYGIAHNGGFYLADNAVITLN